MYCTNCGATFTPGARFCGNCGAAAQPAAPTPAAPSTYDSSTGTWVTPPHQPQQGRAHPVPPGALTPGALSTTGGPHPAPATRLAALAGWVALSSVGYFLFTAIFRGNVLQEIARDATPISVGWGVWNYLEYMSIVDYGSLAVAGFGWCAAVIALATATSRSYAAAATAGIALAMALLSFGFLDMVDYLTSRYYGLDALELLRRFAIPAGISCLFAALVFAASWQLKNLRSTT